MPEEPTHEPGRRSLDAGRKLDAVRLCGAVLIAALLTSSVQAQPYVPDLEGYLDASRLRDVVSRYREDRSTLLHRFDAEGSPVRERKLRSFYGEWRGALDRLDWDPLGLEERLDWLLLKNRIEYEFRKLDRAARIQEETRPLLTFAETIYELYEAKSRMEIPDPESAAAKLVSLKTSVDKTRARLAGKRTETTQIVARRAARILDHLRSLLTRWYEHHRGYDPLFTWWTADPYQQVEETLSEYLDFLRRQAAGEGDGRTGKEDEAPRIIGDPLGRQALLEDLAFEMISYTPEELIAIGERELAFCEDEMRKAARELGYEDWRAALEHVKTLHETPGKQPELIRELGSEAVGFLEEQGLLTIPSLAKEVWQIRMISPERQKINPFFFYNQDAIWVSFPTDDMSHEEKRMSLRGNNIHFSRATVHHELIPGHHLQRFMTSRYNRHRQVFSTPFWGEGWALYWEMVLYDLDFARSPENRIGMLFWRMHRAARIIFSLSFHLDRMSPQEAIDFLVERIGHEKDNATAEVRRSFEADYSPLYQIAYMVGALQFRALREELVSPGKMTDREFHDAVLKGGSMPVEMVRARLRGEKLRRDHRSSWKFAER